MTGQECKIHLKDKDGKHRVLCGDLGYVQDQSGTKKFLASQGIKAKLPILGFIRGGKYKAPTSSLFSIRGI